ncbi:MAG: metal ABC transporter permease [Cytophagaceae bacterium]|nr:metal ABC transporter permease [Cytophagaceae bacterium]
MVAVTCGLLGCFLILRKMAMVGDAISHAVLPGIVFAFLLSGGSREPLTMLLGAGALGLVTTLMIEFFHKKGKLQTDASIGVSFTSLFAIGVILISLKAGQVDLDQECVLYGDIAYIPFDKQLIWTMLAVLICVVLFIWIGYKELFITTFDPSYAAVIGVSVSLWHYLLMGMVSLTTVASFEAVGAILVVTFLIAPPATAYLLTDKFKTMLWISVATGIIAAIGGYWLAWFLNGSVAGAMSTVAGIEFLLAFLFSPLQGLLLKRLKLNG